MRFRQRRSQEVEEGESYYVSMTDMMVGVVFIFIIILVYLGFNFRSSTEALTQAHDAQTVALMQKADSLETHQATLGVDRKNHIVCIPETTLFDDKSSSKSRCFAYTPEAQPEARAPEQLRAESEKVVFMSFLEDRLTQANLTVQSINSDGTISFDTAELFEGDTASLSAAGHNTLNRFAAEVVDQVSCFATGGSRNNCDVSGTLLAVGIVGHAQFDAFTPEGRQRQALALERSVAFHEALVSAQPELGKLKGVNGADPLLRVETHGWSVEGSDNRQTINVYFHMP